MSASTALMLAPTAIRGLSSLFGGSKPSGYEKELNSMASMLKGEYQQSLTERSEYKSGKRSLDARDKKNRESLNNLMGAGNVTNEAKLSTMQESNEAYGAGLNQLMQNVNRFREFSKNRYLNTMGLAERAKQNRVSSFNNNLNSILTPLSQAGGALASAELESGEKFRLTDLFK